MDKYRVYPSGFVGSSEVDFAVIEAEQLNMLMGVGMFHTRLSDTKEQKYCKTTEMLFTQHSSKNHYHDKSMDMPELTMLMRVAYKHIGSSPLLWLKRHNETQFKRDGHISRYHAEFICETLHFAANGISRKMTMQGWNKYFIYGTDDSPISSSSVYKKTLSDTVLSKMSTEDFLSRWITAPAGQQDMLQTLKIMYGRSPDVKRQ